MESEEKPWWEQEPTEDIPTSEDEFEWGRPIDEPAPETIRPDGTFELENDPLATATNGKVSTNDKGQRVVTLYGADGKKVQESVFTDEGKVVTTFDEQGRETSVSKDGQRVSTTSYGADGNPIVTRYDENDSPIYEDEVAQDTNDESEDIFDRGPPIDEPAPETIRPDGTFELGNDSLALATNGKVSTNDKGQRVVTLYDAEGRKVQESVFTDEGKVATTFDEQGRETSVSIDGQKVSTTSYGADGKPDVTYYDENDSPIYVDEEPQDTSVASASGQAVETNQSGGLNAYLQKVSQQLSDQIRKLDPMHQTPQLKDIDSGRM